MVVLIRHHPIPAHQQAVGVVDIIHRVAGLSAQFVQIHFLRQIGVLPQRISVTGLDHVIRQPPLALGRALDEQTVQPGVRDQRYYHGQIAVIYVSGHNLQHFLVLDERKEEFKEPVRTVFLVYAVDERVLELREEIYAVVILHQQQHRIGC